ncbi:MAG TPA: sulfite exporter TauE/SafE family protein [Candidatus Binatia bacterium]|nr:sulfite exporter TauE/SafE family protein [Candidatus Binatia bacterium]
MESFVLISLFDLPVLGATAFLASLVGSVAGSGGTALLLPVLVLYFGVREAIPILTIANLSSNLGRAWFNRREISTPVVGWFSLGSIPMALTGAMLFVLTPPMLLARILGAFLLLTVTWRRLRLRPPKFSSARWFIPIGAVFGLLNGLLEGVGSLMAPFFLAYGLVRGAYIGTDALATTLMQISKLAVFGGTNVIETKILTSGLTLVPFMIAGAFAGKKVVDRISESLFVLIIDVTLLITGVNFLFVK